MDKNGLKLSRWEEVLVGTTVSAVSFPFSLGLIQNFVFKPLRITCKYPVATVLFGGCSVMLSGSIASCAFITSCVAFQKLRPNSASNTRDFNVDIEISKQGMLYCSLGTLVVFKLLGGRTRYVVPSHLFYPGAFAKISVPASGKNYASFSVKRMINSIGQKYGCHSCGKQRPRKFVADHIPPNKLLKFFQMQVFYPQCEMCSQKQGGAIASSSGMKAIQTHASTLRKYHIWLPVPLGIAVIRTILE